MKTPGGIWALRVVTISITVAVILVVGTLAYSAYEDYSALRSELAGGSKQVTAAVTPMGSGASISVNFTVVNKGVYTLNVTLSCDYPTSNVACPKTSVSVPAGAQEVLRFRMNVNDLAQFNSGNRAINGTVDIQMQPLVTLKILTNFGGLVPGAA